MNTTDDAILTFAEAFARLGDRKHSELYLEALATIVRMAKAEERHAARLARPEGDDEDDDRPRLYADQAQPVMMH